MCTIIVILQVRCPQTRNVHIGYNEDFATNTIAANTKRILITNEVYHHYLKYGN